MNFYYTAGNMKKRNAFADERIVMRFVLAAALLTQSWVWAQNPANLQDSVRAAMAASIEKQRQSVQKQAAAVSGFTVATPPVTSFFTVPWPSPVALASPAAGATCEPMPQQDLNSLVEEAAQKESVKAELVHAVIKEESADACAVSVKGAQGLMQIMPETAQQFGS